MTTCLQINTKMFFEMKLTASLEVKERNSNHSFDHNCKPLRLYLKDITLMDSIRENFYCQSENKFNIQNVNSIKSTPCL